MSEGHVFKEWLQIDRPLFKIVVRLEEVKVPCLNDKQVVFPWGLDVEDESVVEGSASVHASVMRVGHLLVLVVDVCLDEYIASAFDVLDWDVFSVEDRKSELIVENWLRADVPDLLFLLHHCVLVLALLLNFNPANCDSLGT